MKITEGQIRQIVREEISALNESSRGAPTPPYRPPLLNYRRPDVTGAEYDLSQSIRELGADEFARRLVRAIGDRERAESIARFIKTI